MNSLAVRDDAMESLLADAVDEYLDAAGRGEAPPIDDFALRHPQIAEPLKQVLGALELLREGGAEDPAGEINLLAGDARRTLGDFHLLREVGRGGMGVVYEAEQVSLGRRVALKVLPFAAALDTRHLQRFKNEAQAAAQLHHQHIVPVYAVGCERGVHYYAMQFIEGQSLAEMLAELRGLAEQQPQAKPNEAPIPAYVLLEGEPANPQPSVRAESSAATAEPTTAEPASASSDSGSEARDSTARLAAASTQRRGSRREYFRSVARLGGEAAAALEHAHGAGVLHRDIKPANLLVDLRGKLWVTDFGLAQIQQDTKLTMTGDLLGTLRYMSPEQSLAQRAPVDHRTDIYSLGATLYELLTLQSVFSGRDRRELLRQIAFDEPIPPRRISRDVPSELETIVLKALAKNPLERYATAQAMADDLARFLRDEAIHARPPTLAQRLSRWSRRNRAALVSATAATVAALVVTVAVLAITALRLNWANERVQGALADRTSALNQVQQEKAKADAALQAEATQRQRVESNVDLALDALDVISLERLEADFLREAEAPPEVRRAVEKALEFYEQFARDNAGSSRARSAVARAYHRVGDTRRWMGEHAAAVQAYDRAAELLGQLIEQSPQPISYRRELGRVRLAMAESLRRLRRYTEAGRQHEQALAICQAVVQEQPGDAASQHELASAFMGQSQFQYETSHLPETIADLRKALTILTDLVQASPDDISLRRSLGTVHHTLSTHLMDQGEVAEAMRHIERGLEIRRALCRERPEDNAFRYELAASLNNLAGLKQREGKSAPAVQYHQQVLAIRRDLAERFPGVPRYRQDMAHSHRHLANTLASQGNAPAALEEFRKSLELWTALHKELPDVAECRFEMGRVKSRLGTVLAQTGAAEEAETELAEAIAIAEELCAAYPGHHEYRSLLGDGCHELGDLLVRRSKWDVARGRLLQAVELRRELCREFPNLADYQHELASSVLTLGVGLDARGSPTEALPLVSEAVALREKLVAEQPTMTRFRHGLAVALNNLAKVHHSLKQPTDALDACRRSLKIHEELMAEHPEALSFRRTGGMALFNFGYRRLLSGEQEEAAGYFRRGIDLETAVLKENPKDAEALRFLRAMIPQLLVAVIRQKRHAEAASVAEDMVRWFPEGREYLAAAGTLATCVKVAEEDPGLETARRSELCRTYAQKSVEWLRLSAKKGMKLTSYLDSPTMRTLHSYEEFQAFRRELESR